MTTYEVRVTSNPNDPADRGFPIALAQTWADAVAIRDWAIRAGLWAFISVVRS